jgi:hypothetical protein
MPSKYYPPPSFTLNVWKEDENDARCNLDIAN